MSTRAIIATPTAKGYKTAWCWCDGMPSDLGQILRSKFKTKALVDELISHHSFEALDTKKGKEEFEHDCPEYTKHGGYFDELSNGTYLLKYGHHGKTVAGMGKYGFFKNIKDMLGQDLNYVYVFDPANGTWETYK